jgi:hypothetical protein
MFLFFIGVFEAIAFAGKKLSNIPTRNWNGSAYQR